MCVHYITARIEQIDKEIAPMASSCGEACKAIFVFVCTENKLKVHLIRRERARLSLGQNITAGEIPRGQFGVSGC